MKLEETDKWLTIFSWRWWDVYCRLICCQLVRVDLETRPLNKFVVLLQMLTLYGRIKTAQQRTYTAIRWLVHWPLMVLLHLIQWGGAWAGCGVEIQGQINPSLKSFQEQFCCIEHILCWCVSSRFVNKQFVNAGLYLLFQSNTTGGDFYHCTCYWQ